MQTAPPVMNPTMRPMSSSSLASSKVIVTQPTPRVGEPSIGTVRRTRATLQMACRPRSGMPAAIDGHELVANFGVERLGLDAAEDVERPSHLGEVLGAMRAFGQMRLEPGALAARQGTFEVVGHQLDCLTAHDGAATKQHGSALPQLSGEHAPDARAAAVKEHALVGIA